MNNSNILKEVKLFLLHNDLRKDIIFVFILFS